MKLIFNDYDPKDVLLIIREWTGLTQKEFGKTIGKSERTIQDYEGGRINYNVQLIKTICKVHNIKITIEKK